MAIELGTCVACAGRLWQTDGEPRACDNCLATSDGRAAVKAAEKADDQAVIDARAAEIASLESQIRSIKGEKAAEDKAAAEDPDAKAAKAKAAKAKATRAKAAKAKDAAAEDAEPAVTAPTPSTWVFGSKGND